MPCLKKNTFDLIKNEVHVWSSTLNTSHSVLQRYVNLLSSEEKQRADGYVFFKDYSHFVIRRAILRLILSFYTRVPPKNIALIANQHGKPQLDPKKSEFQLSFNGSHANDFVYYAISYESNVGIDIEHVQENQHVEGLAKVILNSEEYKIFEKLSISERNDFFYRHWSLKEALVKAIGVGLVYPLQEIHIEFSDRLAPRLLRFDQKECSNQWSLVSLKTPPNYVGFVALNGNFELLKYLEFTNNE